MEEKIKLYEQTHYVRVCRLVLGLLGAENEFVQAWK